MLVNCAGYAVVGRFEDLPVEDFKVIGVLTFIKAEMFHFQKDPNLRQVDLYFLRREVPVAVVSDV